MLRNPGWFWICKTRGHMPYHVHPHSGKVIEGQRKKLGDKVLSTSRYASDSGEWKPPGQSVGITIQSEKVYWVEPTPAPNPKQPRISYSTAMTAK